MFDNNISWLKWDIINIIFSGRKLLGVEQQLFYHATATAQATERSRPSWIKSDLSSHTHCKNSCFLALFSSWFISSQLQCFYKNTTLILSSWHEFLILWNSSLLELTIFLAQFLLPLKLLRHHWRIIEFSGSRSSRKSVFFSLPSCSKAHQSSSQFAPSAK